MKGGLIDRKRYTAIIQGQAVRRTLNRKRMSIWVEYEGECRRQEKVYDNSSSVSSDEDREHKEAVNVG
ncbi:unnamed protein product [Cylindrotheca closterium]|uniref:Uncharacterized protein n=1 Tax=Cylindrotheca closterium TaxID=2856 RepID=A0AAD2FH71_9STRA|nr:unnamed protein product [Cylindrotheca closterium]